MQITPNKVFRAWRLCLIHADVMINYLKDHCPTISQVYYPIHPKKHEKVKQGVHLIFRCKRGIGIGYLLPHR